MFMRPLMSISAKHDFTVRKVENGVTQDEEMELSVGLLGLQITDEESGASSLDNNASSLDNGASSLYQAPACIYNIGIYQAPKNDVFCRTESDLVFVLLAGEDRRAAVIFDTKFNNFNAELIIFDTEFNIFNTGED